MSATTCRNVRKQLGSFVDGELSGGERLAVTRHLGECRTCELEAEALRCLGLALRAEAPTVDASGLRGLAAGVVSRVVAEKAQSWRVQFLRAFEDWHWVMIGTGSVIGTTACTLLVASVLLFGPKTERPDSLAGRLNSSDMSAGTLFVVATPVGDDKSSMLMQFEGAGGPTSSASLADVPSAMGIADESAMASAFADMVTRGGKLVELSAMSAQERLRAEALLDNIHRLRSADQRSSATGPVTVHGLWLVANASVSAKAL
ncbi:MAG TPA: zf-HC2 domain-containing protein [Vicinamibacterales bacterium]